MFAPNAGTQGQFFAEALRQELEKISQFYTGKETELEVGIPADLQCAPLFGGSRRTLTGILAWSAMPPSSVAISKGMHVARCPDGNVPLGVAWSGPHVRS